MRLVLTVILAAAVCVGLAACSSNNNGKANQATVAATAPPPQTAAARGLSTQAGATVPAAGFSTPAPPPADVLAVLDKVKLTITELPRGFSYGQFQAFQSNDQAINGYDVDPKTLLDRLNSTGRLGGYIQQINTGDGDAGAGATEEIWKDAAGARAYFDNFPRPAKGLMYQEITLPQPLGQQVFAYQYTQNGPGGNQTGYSIAWRNGRFILGVGEAFPSGKESLDKLLVLANLMDAKATAAQQ